ncbi:MAG: ABC transporter permease [Pseudobacteriovorax sp.]|nr:ABC transporter permease [Pseudobacteriovorax sp.]
MTILKILIWKDLKDFIRDRRSLLTLVSLVIGFPLLYIGILGITASKVESDRNKTITVEMFRGERAKDLSRFLETQGMDVQQKSGDFDKQTFLDGPNSLAIVIPSVFTLSGPMGGQKQRHSIDLMVDHRDQDAQKQLQTIQGLLTAYGQSIGNRRLLLRGVNPAITDGIKVRLVELNQETMAASIVLQLLAAVLSISCFMSTLYLTIDSISGEKQRQTLEPVFMLPLHRWQIYWAKIVVCCLVALLSLIAGALFFTYICRHPSFQSAVGLYAEFSYGLAMQGVFIFFPLAILAVSLQLLIATVSRSIKEAQGLASLLGIGGMLPAILASTLDLDGDSLVVQLLPSISQAKLMEGLIKTSEIPVSQMFLSCAGSLIVAVLAFFIGQLYFYQEKVLKTT